MSKRDLQESVKIEFTANPAQREFIEDRHQATLFDARKGH